MDVRQILAKKRDGLELRTEEIRFLVDEYVRGTVPDYQMAAFLMAVYINGMTARETRDLTRAMLESGERARFPGLKRPLVDKHSTGGVGDKVSLVLAPLLAACGAAVPMMSGRSLEHSGGTLDKLEAIPGYRTDLSLEEFRRQVSEIGVAITGQTFELAPADRKLYALRDATATVASVPLVTASILSKKLAEGIDYLVLDVKVGSGAFFKRRREARHLAESLLTVATEFGLGVRAVLTDMDQPLGRAIGNWVEVEESIHALHGNGPPDLMEVTFALGEQLLELCGLATGAEAQSVLRSAIETGRAWEVFLRLVAAQGGDVHVVENPSRYPPARHQLLVEAETGGFVRRLNAYKIGMAAAYLGAGRFRMEDEVDPHAGVILLKVAGDEVSPGEAIAKLTTSTRPDAMGVAAQLVREAFEFSDKRPIVRSRVLQVLRPQATGG